MQSYHSNIKEKINKRMCCPGSPLQKLNVVQMEIRSTKKHQSFECVITMVAMMPLHIYSYLTQILNNIANMHV